MLVTKKQEHSALQMSKYVKEKSEQ